MEETQIESEVVVTDDLPEESVAEEEEHTEQVGPSLEEEDSVPALAG